METIPWLYVLCVVAPLLGVCLGALVIEVWPLFFPKKLSKDHCNRLKRARASHRRKQNIYCAYNASGPVIKFRTVKILPHTLDRDILD